MPRKELTEAETLAILQDLAEYDNPEAYADPAKPHVYRLRIPGKPYSETAAVLRIELDGGELRSALRALMSVALNHIPFSAEDREKYLASEPYQLSEIDMYLFFLRNFPKLMTDFFMTISQIALVSSGSVGSLTFSGDERKAFEKNQKDLLELNLRRLRKKIKQMLRTRTRGGKTSSLAPDLRQSLHLTYDGFHIAAKTIKKHHDSLFGTYKKQHHRLSPKDWQAFRIEHAVKVFSEQPKEFLELFARPDKPSASDAAYAWLAHTTGLAQSYVTNLVKDLRKQAREKPPSQPDNETK